MSRRARITSEKVSYQVTPGNRFTGFYHWTNDNQLRGASRFVPRESMLDKDNPVRMTKGEWQTVRGNSLVTSVQYGRWDFNGVYDGIAPGKVSTIDIATLFVTGDHFTQAATATGGERTRAGITPRASSAGTSRICSAAITNSRRGSTTCGAGSTTGYAGPGSRASSTTSSVQQRRALPDRHDERAGQRPEPRQLPRRVWAGLVDPRAPADAQPGDPLRARQRVCAGAVPRGRATLPRPSAGTRFSS